MRLLLLRLTMTTLTAAAALLTRGVLASSHHHPNSKPTTRWAKTLNWNVAAVNNNPFEYWLSYDDEKYVALMGAVEDFIELKDPSVDVPVALVFSPDHFSQLERLLEGAFPSAMTPEMKTAVRKRYADDLANRKIVSGFLKDAELGKKRFISMPDRITNTMATGTMRRVAREDSSSSSHYEEEIEKHRPTPINCYTGRFSTVDEWFTQWKTFMFEDRVKGATPVSLLKSIPRSKYPELSVEDEKVSLPLQVVALAIFDAILVHMLNQVTGNPELWQEMRAKICLALNSRKWNRVLEILNSPLYRDSDVLFLQEVSNAFVARARREMPDYTFFAPGGGAGKSSRDQLSVIAIKKISLHPSIARAATHPESEVADVTGAVEALFPGEAKVPVEPGDLLVVETKEGLVLASFHGDTDGLATIPVLEAIDRYVKQKPGRTLVFGMDANSYNRVSAKGKQLDVRQLGEKLVALGLASCWTPDGRGAPNPENFTTFNARTYLQPQLNKAAGKNELRQKGDVNPKDFILAYASRDGPVFEGVRKDNTGRGEYVEDMVFPTLEFPSDHAVVSVKWRVDHPGASDARAEL